MHLDDLLRNLLAAYACATCSGTPQAAGNLYR